MEKSCSTCRHESEALNSAHCITCSVAERKADNWEQKELKVFTAEQLMKKQEIPNEIKSEEGHVWNLHSLCTTFHENGRKERDKELRLGFPGKMKLFLQRFTIYRLT